MKRLVMLGVVTLTVATLSAMSVYGQGETALTAGGGGVFPAGASFSGVPLSAVKFGIGVTIDGSAAEGEFHTTLIGASVLGLEQRIEVEGRASFGSVASGTVTFSGWSTVDLGDGIAVLPDIPFTVAIGTNAAGTGTITLTLDGTTLPAVTLSEGSLAIK